MIDSLLAPATVTRTLSSMSAVMADEGEVCERMARTTNGWAGVGVEDNRKEGMGMRDEKRCLNLYSVNDIHNPASCLQLEGHIHLVQSHQSSLDNVGKLIHRYEC